MANRAFQRALASLVHPLTAGAVVVLLANDFILRRLWPSWLTGKLGDLAWLVFAPLALAAILAWLIPTRWRQQERITGLLAFALTGLTFALVKTVPALHTAGVRAYEALFGAPSMLLVDPTDLLALPGLLAGWAVWQTRDTAPSPLPRLGLTVLTLAALATVANSSAPNYGIECVVLQPDDTLLTRTSWGDFGTYQSRDGGLTWEEAPPGRQADGSSCQRHREAWELRPPDSAGVVYRLGPGTGIDRSVDGGQTWAREVNLQGSEARSAYQALTGEGNVIASAGPLDAVVDPATGNVVVAMGHDGVLTRTPDGTWHWVAVGPYELELVDSPGETLHLLRGELILALGLAALVLSTLALLVDEVHWLGLPLPLAAWAIWVVSLLMEPALSLTPSNYFALFIFAGMGVVILLAVVSLAVTGVRAYRSGGGWQRAAVAALLAGLLFVLPYVLWSLGGIPRYTTATLFALALSASALVGGAVWVRQSLPAEVREQRILRLRGWGRT